MKIKRSVFLLFLALGFLAGGLSGFTAELSDRAAEISRTEQRSDLTRPTVKGQKRLSKQLDEKRKPKTFLEKLSFNYSALQGYDRNARHNSQHKGSWFTDQEFTAGFTDRPTDNFIYHVDYKMEYDFYYEFNYRTSFANAVNVRTAYKMNESLFLETDYDLDIFRRPDFAEGDYNGHQVKIGLKHYLIARKLYHKLFYQFGVKDYPKFKARDSSENETASDREDLTNRFGYEIGHYPAKNILLRLRGQIGRNDSNDQLRDFYDYDFYQLTPTVSWRINKKAHWTGGFQYQRNEYDQRDFSGSANRENVYNIFGNFQYALTKSVEWIFYASYVKYDGDVPQLNFQDSILATGLQINF